MVRFSLKRLTTLAAVGTVGGFWYFSDPRATGYRYLVMPTGRLLVPDGEQAHRLTIELMKYPFLNPRLPGKWRQLVDPHNLLGTELFGDAVNPKVRKLFVNTPVGIAAGFDKNGEAIDSLVNIGFSWVEVGSVTPLPQPGNPKPRVFRLENDKAFVNRYGFNSDGHALVAARLQTRPASRPHGQVLAVNLGKNKLGDEVQDYVRGVQVFGGLADALVVNVSSPNTPGLRDLQAGGKLGDLLTTLVAERDALPYGELPPLLVKIAPDVSLDQIKAIATAVKQSHVDGVIVGNTTIGRPSTLQSDRSVVAENGGLSGPPVKPLELQALRLLRHEVGPKVTILGCGGIQTAEDALDFARAGANAVQLYTSFAYDGPEKPAVIAEDLVKLLEGKKWSDVASGNLEN